MSMGVPSPRERERITQVLPGQGWRRCEVAILETRGEVRSELSTVIGFALFQWDEILQGELKSLFELRPLIVGTEVATTKQSAQEEGTKPKGSAHGSTTGGRASPVSNIAGSLARSTACAIAM